MTLPFQDRADGGRALAQLVQRRGHAGAATLVLGVARGGVPVAYAVAQALGAPLDVFLVRKLGVPGQEELAFGAIASGGVKVLNDDIVSAVGLTDQDIALIVARESDVIARAERLYRQGRPPLAIDQAHVILVDDGLATGASMRAAARAARAQNPARVVVAVPVGSREACVGLQADADDVVCAATPEPFEAVGLWYRDFSQTTDQEVADLLRRATRS